MRNPLSSAISCLSFISSGVSEHVADEKQKQSILEDVGIMDASLQFINELLPNSCSESLEFIEDLLLRIVTSFGKQFSEESRTEEEITNYSKAIANMLKMQIESYKLRQL